MMPCRVPASCIRICVCCSDGNTLTMRSIVLAGARRVQRPQHQVAGLGRGHREADRLQIAQLADQDDVRVLAQARRRASVKPVVSEPISRWLM